MRGEHGVRQNDEAAYACYICIENLGNPAMSHFVETIYLPYFEKDDTTGKVIFTGVR